jgi:hypothetical protein
VLERSTAELAAARAASDDARYELARHLNTVSGGFGVVGQSDVRQARHMGRHKAWWHAVLGGAGVLAAAHGSRHC